MKCKITFRDFVTRPTHHCFPLGLDFDGSLKTLYRLMPKSWYQNYPIVGEHAVVKFVAQLVTIDTMTC